MESKNLLISQLKEELLANQKLIEAALNELKMKDSLIQKLVSSSKPPSIRKDIAKPGQRKREMPAHPAQGLREDEWLMVRRHPPRSC